MADEIEIVDYDANWPRLFEEERALLRRVLPADQILAIEGVGAQAGADLRDDRPLPAMADWVLTA